MNRRSFIVSASIVSSLPASLATLGCNSSTTIADINTVLDAATNVLLVADPSATWIPELQKAIAALKTAEGTWQAGGAETVVVDALNTLVAVTAVIPVTAAYSPLIDVLVAGIEVVIGLFPTTVTSTVVTANARSVNPHLTAKTNVVIHHRLFRSKAEDFRATWNTTAIAHGLKNATI